MRKGKNRICNICGISVKPGGIGGHKALAHGIREKTVIKYISDVPAYQSFEPCDDTRDEAPGEVSDINVIHHPIDSVKERKEMVEKSIEPIIKNISNIAGKNLTECMRPDDNHLYTETDIKILLGKWINYQQYSEQPDLLLRQFTKMDLIEDFEKRFECKFSDVRKANQQISDGSTAQEQYEFAAKYAHLKYSR